MTNTGKYGMIDIENYPNSELDGMLHDILLQLSTEQLKWLWEECKRRCLCE